MADKAEKAKKRKRSTDGSSMPSKRVAIADDGPVTVSLEHSSKWTPIVADTAGVNIPTSISLMPYTKVRKNEHRQREHNGDIAANELLLHSSEHPKLDYIGREEELGESDALLKHYIGVYDPETNALKVMEVRKMVVRGSVRAHQATADEGISTNMRELRNELGQTFGTKKARKAIASVTENAISPDKSLRVSGAKPDSASAALLTNMAEATAGMATKEELSAAAEAAKPIPKANLEATVPQDVYTSASLVGMETMKIIPVRKWEVDIKANKEIPVSSRFVASRMVKAAQHSTERLKLLRYMLLLIEFLNSSSKSGRGGERRLPKRDELKSIAGEIPESVLEGVKRKFSDGGFITKFKVDLLCTHLCALACIVDSFEVDTWDLKEDLKLGPKDIEQYFKEIGAKGFVFPEALRKKLGIDKAAAAQRKVFKLKVPLEFPKLGMGRRR